jgi:hypothetical protein
MTGAATILDDVARIGAHIEPDGDRLILHAGDRPIPADLVERVRAAKPELLAALSQPPSPAASRYAVALAALTERCPALVEAERCEACRRAGTPQYPLLECAYGGHALLLHHACIDAFPESEAAQSDRWAPLGAVCDFCGKPGGRLEDITYLGAPVGDVPVHFDCSAAWFARLDAASSVESVTYRDRGRDGAARRRTRCAVEPSSASFAAALTSLERRCPNYVEPNRWHQAVEDGRRFVTQWGEKGAGLSWTERDLFGLHASPAKPHPSYQRLSRRDQTGLIWLLQGWPVVALTAASATIKSPSGAPLVFRKAGQTTAKPPTQCSAAPEVAK